MSVARYWASFPEAEEGRFFLWLPVFLSLGIGGYFSLLWEPTLGEVAGAFGLAVLGAGLLMRKGQLLLLPVLIVMVASGFALAKFRTERVRGPVLAKARGSYLVEGQIEHLERLSGGQKRLVLTHLKLSGIAADQTPVRVRIVSRIRDRPLFVGARVALKAVLRPPPGPVRPQGFDFARQVWFARIGGVGFAISKIALLAGPSPDDWRFVVERARKKVAKRIRDVISGPGAEIAVALITGEKSSIDQQVLEDIRAAGLAHMLAISGMHMGLVSGVAYWGLRALLAFSATLVLLFDVRRIAAVLAIIVAGGYLLLSGMAISTLRAFIMVSIMFIAIFLGRRALSLRNVAVAALLILVFWPESLLQVGFQMSFASVTALIAYYEAREKKHIKDHSELLFVRFLDQLADGFRAIFMTTLVAGMAVAPIAIYHFHHVTPYSVIGNVLAIPVLTLVVMPMALLALLVMPFGLHALPLLVMGQGNGLIIRVAHLVAGFHGARVNVGTISPSAFLLIIAGGLWLCLWKSSYRFWGLMLIAPGFVLSSFHERPLLLIERDGKNIVLIDQNHVSWPVSSHMGRYSLARWKSAYATHFARQNVKTNKGTADRDKTMPSLKGPWHCDPYGCTARTHGLLIAYSTHPGALAEDCARADILVATYPVPRHFAGCKETIKRIDRRAIKRNGAYAIYVKERSTRLINARQIRGARPWAVHN